MLFTLFMIFHQNEYIVTHISKLNQIITLKNTVSTEMFKWKIKSIVTFLERFKWRCTSIGFKKNFLFTFLGKSFKSDIGDTLMKYLNFFAKNNLCSTLSGLISKIWFICYTLSNLFEIRIVKFFNTALFGWNLNCSYLNEIKYVNLFYHHYTMVCMF